MNNPGVYDLGDIVLTAERTDDVITEGSSAAGAAQSFIDRLEGVVSITLQAKLVYGSGGTTIVAVVETSLDQGSSWIEVCRFDFTTANAQKAANLSANAAAAVAAIAPLSTDGKLDGIIGDRLRCRVTSTGVYAGNTSLSIRAVAR